MSRTPIHPSTPSRSFSTPIVDAFRHAHNNATREFDQFYGYVSQVMTPRRSQQQQSPIRKTTSRHGSQQSPIRKTTPKHKSQQSPVRKTTPRHESQQSPVRTTSLTPLMANLASTPTKRRRDYPPPRAMTLTPNTDRSIMRFDDPEDDYLPTYLESPRALKRQREVPSSPSMFLQDQLLDESRRLDELQHHFDIVQQRCLALTSRSAMPIVIPQASTPKHEKSPLKYIPSPQKYKPLPPKDHASPQKSPTKYIPQRDSIPSTSEDLMTDIPKAQLKSAKTITTPNGTRVENKYWAEIHGQDDAFWMDSNKKNHLTDRLEQAKQDIPPQRPHPYPADFFEELNQTIKGKLNDDTL